MPNIKLDEISTRAPKELSKESTKKQTAQLLDELNELQNLLYAASTH